MTRTASGTAGFTLVELLISVAILGLIVMVLSDSIATASKLFAREQTIAADRNLWVIERRLREWIETMPTQTIESDEREPFVPIRGHERVLEFVRFEPAGTTRGGPMRYRLLVEEGALVLERAPLRGLADFPTPAGEPGRRVLVDRIDAAGFRYGAMTGEGWLWRTVWPLTDDAPDAVRLVYRRAGQVADLIMVTTS